MQVEHFTASCGVTVTDVASAEGGRRWRAPTPATGSRSSRSRSAGSRRRRCATRRPPAVRSSSGSTRRTARSSGPRRCPAPAARTRTERSPRRSRRRPAGPHGLHLVFVAPPGGATTNLFALDELTFGGKGVSEDSAPTASIVPERHVRPDAARGGLHRRGRRPRGHRGHVRVGLRVRRDGRRDDEGRVAHVHHPGHQDGGADRHATRAARRARSPSTSAPTRRSWRARATTTSSARTLDTSAGRRVRRNDQFLSVSGGALNIDAQKPGHPRRRPGPAEHRAPGPARRPVRGPRPRG